MLSQGENEKRFGLLRLFLSLSLFFLSSFSKEKNDPGHLKTAPSSSSSFAWTKERIQRERERETLYLWSQHVKKKPFQKIESFFSSSSSSSVDCIIFAAAIFSSLFFLPHNKMRAKNQHKTLEKWDEKSLFSLRFLSPTSKEKAEEEGFEDRDVQNIPPPKKETCTSNKNCSHLNN